MVHTKRSRKAGLPPGSLVYVGEHRASAISISRFDYSRAAFHEHEFSSISQALVVPRGKGMVTWINVDGVHLAEVIGKIGAHFGLHPLLLEDVMNTEQRPKVEEYGDTFFLVMRMLSVAHPDAPMRSEQVAIVVGRDFVLSFQERPGDVFGPVRQRIREKPSKLRSACADFLAYSLMDAIVDNYFGVLESLGEKVEALEDEIIKAPQHRTLRTLYHLKRELLFLRKAVWPLREMTGSIGRADARVFSKETRVYVRDMHDHIVQVIDTVETQREMLSELVDIYLSSQGNRLNEIMKVLTVITTIFIPLTFISSIYGMNFRFMPELGWRLGYPLVVGVMLIIGLVMVYFFRQKKWL